MNLLNNPEKRKWMIVVTIFIAIICNYLDRQLLSILKPTIKAAFDMNDDGYAFIVNIFLICYAVMYPISGILVDRFGPKKVMFLGILAWSAACIGGGLSTNMEQFAFFRGLLGLAEPTIFAGQIVAVTVWFEKRQRATANSLCTAGGSIGTVVAPIVIAWLSTIFPWNDVFVLAGAIGILIAIVWMAVYADPPKEILDVTLSESAANRHHGKAFTWGGLWKTRTLWGVLLIRFVSDPVWYFCLFWLPGYLQEDSGLTLIQVGWVGWIPFLFGAVGGVLTSAWSDKMVRKGMDPLRARKRMMTLVAVAAPVHLHALFQRPAAVLERRGHHRLVQPDRHHVPELALHDLRGDRRGIPRTQRSQRSRHHGRLRGRGRSDLQLLRRATAEHHGTVAFPRNGRPALDRCRDTLENDTPRNPAGKTSCTKIKTETMEKKITTVREPARDIPVRASADILIVGGGPAGLMAAQAAAGEGLKVMLIESRGYLGGNLTIGLPILGFLGQKGNQIIEGLPQRFIDRLQERGAASGHRPCKLHVSLTIIDPEESKTLAQQLMEEAGVEVLMYVFCTDVIREGNEVKGVVIESKAGREAILARTVIDCTGDADVAFRAGVECRKGDAEGGMQPPTLMFSMRGVATQRLRDAIAEHPDIYDMDIMPAESFRNEKFITVGLRNQIAKAREAGIDLPVARTILITGMSEDEIWVNMSRVNGVDPTDPGSYTRGEIEARKQVYRIRKYLRQFVPGFENAWMDRVAPFMGIRESRVTVGKYVLTAEDILACRHFDDAIAVASYPVDLHHPKGGDCTLEYCGDCYDIPYRVLVPEKVENLLVAGRCASFTHEAMASTRVMSTCMALGEAAGRAARIALRDGVKPSQADVAKLRSELKRTGAYLR